jgi:hypothetical protein
LKIGLLLEKLGTEIDTQTVGRRNYGPICLSFIMNSETKILTELHSEVVRNSLIHTGKRGRRLEGDIYN